jgi:hypothetical protein
MTRLKEWISGADERVTSKQHDALSNGFVDLGIEKLNNPAEWKDRGAVCVTAEELAERVWGENYLDACLNCTQRWFLQSMGTRKGDEEFFNEHLPGKVLLNVTETYITAHYNVWDEKPNGKKKELVPRVPANDYEMRVSTSKGGACFGVLICDESHPMQILKDRDFINRTEAAHRVATVKKERLDQEEQQRQSRLRLDPPKLDEEDQL